MNVTSLTTWKNYNLNVSRNQELAPSVGELREND